MIGLQNTGVQLDSDGYLIGDHDGDRERTSVSHIYAIGDILKVIPDALQAKKMLLL